MSTVKISELPVITALGANTAQTIFLAVNTITDITGQLTGTTLAQGLYSHNVLNVGNNEVLLANVLGQFAGSSDTFVQLNLQNNDGNGSGDIVVTANNGTESTYFVDMGMNGDRFTSEPYSSMKALDGYLYIQGSTGLPGGNLVIGTATPNKNVNIILGGTNKEKIFAQFIDNTGFKMVNRPVIFQDGTSQNTAAAPFLHSNASFLQANSAYGSQNTTGTYANAAFIRANAAFSAANSAGVYANTAADTAAQGIINASTADLKAVTAGNYANSAFLKANTPHAIANSAALYANAAFLSANTPSHVANSAALYANSAFLSANTPHAIANSAALYANGAFAKANSALANTSGTFAGDLSITGNLNVLSVTSSGILSVNAVSTVANSPAATISGAVSAFSSNPTNQGYMLQITGYQNTPTRMILDSFGANSYGLFAARTARGTAQTPTATANGDILFRMSGNGYANSFSQFGVARIDFVATENYTDTSKGSEIQIWNTIPGTNTLNKIVSFNASHAEFSGYIMPDKGFVYTPRIPSGNQTTITIDYLTDSMIKANLVADLTVSHSNFLAGKVVEVWLVNQGGTGRTVTHGISALNSTTNSTTFTIPATSAAHLRFFSIDGDLANTFVSVIYA